MKNVCPSTVTAPTPSYWTTPDGERLLEQILAVVESVNPKVCSPSERATAALEIKKQLSTHPPDLLNEGLEIALGRQRARIVLGPWAEKALVSRRALEQCSRPTIAERHAVAFRRCSRVLEIGTGLGIDLAAIARQAQSVVTIDESGEVAARAAYNLALQGITNVTFYTGRAEEIIGSLDLSQFDGLWADPSRRTQSGEKIREPELYGPPLSFVQSLPIHGPCGIKIAPGARMDPGDGWQREFIGFEGECIEQTLWRGHGEGDRSVVIVDAQGQLSPYQWSPNNDGEPTVVSPLTSVGGYLIEPHTAVITAEAVNSLYSSEGFSLFDPSLSYGFSHTLPRSSPLWTAFKIEYVARYSLKELAKKLRELEWNNRTEIKKRHFHEEPETIRAKLRLPAPTATVNRFGTIIVARIGGAPMVFLAERVV